MISQYVFTRNSGKIHIGPHGNPNEGLACVGRTDSVSQEDLTTLHTISGFKGAVHKTGSNNEYLPHWTIQWLPSGNLAVGKTTYIPARTSLNRANHLAHFYILDRELALRTSDHMEQWFNLPFIEYDLNPSDLPEQEGHDLWILEKLREYETLEQAGAAPVEIVPFRELLESHLPLYTDEVRNMVEAIADAAAYRDRQVLFSYDCFGEDGEWTCIQWMGWLYRLLPMHLRSQVGIAMPYHELCDVKSTQLAMIPQCNVRVNNNIVTYRNSDSPGETARGVGYNYLYADAAFYHMDSPERELFAAENNYFCAFLYKAIDDLYDDETGRVNEDLQEFYRRLEREGWKEEEILSEPAALELMVFPQAQSFLQLPEGALKERLYSWLDLLQEMAGQRCFPVEGCAGLQRELLDRIYDYGSIGSHEKWLQTLKKILEAPLNQGLAQLCVDWAAIACAGIWAEDPQRALDSSAKWFGSVSYQGETVAKWIFAQLITPGDEERQAAWQKAGVLCDAQGTMQRISDQVMLNVRGCNDIKQYFGSLNRTAFLIDRLADRMLDEMGYRLEEHTKQWAKQGHIQADPPTIRVLYTTVHTTEGGNSNTIVLINRVAQLLLDYCKAQVQAKYQNAGQEELSELRKLCITTEDEQMRRFYASLYADLIAKVREDLRNAELGPMLLRKASRLLRLCDDEPTWAMYEAACARILGLDSWERNGVVALAQFATPLWLSEMLSLKCLRPRENCRAANALCALECVLDSREIPPMLAALLGPNEYKLIMQILGGMFRSGKLEMKPDQLYRISANPRNSALNSEDALVLIRRYSMEKFMAYLDWLLEKGHCNEFLNVLNALKREDELLRGMDREVFLQIMTMLYRAYYDEVIPNKLAMDASKLSHSLWARYDDKNMVMRMRKNQYVIDN